MSTVRRLLLPALTAGLLLAAAAPAQAAPPVGEWTRPTSDDPYHRTRDAVAGTAHDPDGGGIDRINFTLEERGEPGPAECAAAIPDGQQEQTFGGHTGTTAVGFELGIHFPCNRNYTVTMTVRAKPSGFLDSDNQAGPVTLDFGVAIPPARVAGLAATYDKATNEVTVTWSANPEPDLVEYAVGRAEPGGGFEPFALVPRGQHTVVDDDIDRDGGDYRYQVFAVRTGPDADVALVPSQEPHAVATASVPRPPSSTTSTTLRGSGSGFSSNGGDGPSGGGSDGGGGGGGRGSRAGSGSGAGSGGGLNLSSFDQLRAQARQRGTSPFRLSTPTTLDTGFGQLDFGERPPRPETSSSGDGEALGDGAVIAELDDDGDGRRALLVPIAGGLALFVGAMQLRFINKRAGLAA